MTKDSYTVTIDDINNIKQDVNALKQDVGFIKKDIEKLNSDINNAFVLLRKDNELFMNKVIKDNELFMQNIKSSFELFSEKTNNGVKFGNRILAGLTLIAVPLTLFIINLYFKK